MFSDRLRHLRESKGLTQQQLADKLDVSKSTIANYECGFREPKDNAIWIKISKYFNVSIDYLMDIDDNQNITSSQFDLKTLNYNSSDESKQELATLMQDILDNVSDENQINQIKMFLETYKK